MAINTTDSLKGRRLLLVVTGSIAAVKTPILISSLVKAGAEVRCVVSPSASRLVSPLSLATISRNRCYQDEDQWSARERRPLHIALAEWAEIVIVAPLSASSLSRWTQGLGEGLVASLLLACERPVIAAAAMNTAMWSNPAVKRNWQELTNNRRVLALSPSSGLLACDRIGEGRMPNPDLIELAIRSGTINQKDDGTFPKDFEGLRLLISAGPTIEPLDPARIITNRSSGKMGVLLAQAARFRGATIDLVHGPLQVPDTWLEGINTYQVKTAKEMQEVMSSLQASANAVLMTAAVADLRRKNGADTEKIKKESLINSFTKDLEKVPDLLSSLIKNRSENQVFLGFAAVTGNKKQIQDKAKEKLLKKGCDLLFANPIDQSGQGFEANSNGGILLGCKGMSLTIPVNSKLIVAHQLLDALAALQANVSKVT